MTSRTRVYWFEDDVPRGGWQTMAEFHPMEHDDIPSREDWANEALSTLTDKQRFVMECLFGLRDGYEYTQDEIAGMMGVSQISVHKIQARALRRMKRGLSNPGIG